MRRTYVIELTEDVKNPEVDRRRSEWRSQPILPKGTRFVVLEHDEVSISDLKYTVKSIRKANGLGSVYDRSDLGRAILAVAVEVEPKTAAEFIQVHECINCEQVVRILLEKGRITEEDFELVHDVLIEEDIEEEEAAL